jgi:hypothetical protein
MEIARAVPHPVFPDGPEGRCGHGSESRRTPVSRTVAIYDDRHVSVGVPSSIAPRLSRSLEKEVFFCFLFFIPRLTTYLTGFQHRLVVDRRES